MSTAVDERRTRYHTGPKKEKEKQQPVLWGTQEVNPGCEMY
jgi:hypothetical protein